MGCRRRSTRFHGGVSTDRGGPSATVLVAVGALLPLVACLLLSTARDMVANTNLALVLVLVVVAAASFGSRATGLSAAVVSAVGFDVFLTQPYGQLRIHSAADVVTTVLLLLIGVAVTELALWGRRQQARASEQRGYLDGILQTTGSLAGAMSARKLIEHVEGQLVDLLDLDRAYYVTAFDRAAPVLQSDGTVTQRGRALDVDRIGLPTDTEVVLMVGSTVESRGAFQLVAATHVTRPTLRQRQVAALLADHVAAALRQEANH